MQEDSYLTVFLHLISHTVHIAIRIKDETSLIHPNSYEFRGIPRYRVNSVFMNELWFFFHGNHMTLEM